MKKLFYSFLKVMLLVITLLCPLSLDATTFHQGTIYVEYGKTTTVTLPDFLISEYNNYSAVPYTGGGSLSWSVSNSNLVIEWTANFSCYIRPRSGSVFPSSVTLTAQFYSWYGTSLMDTKATWNVKLKEASVSVTDITLNSTAVTLSVGKTTQLSAAILPSNATVPSIYWSTDNSNVATVDNNGLVTAVGIGTANITCTAYDDSRKQATCKVVVRENLEEPTDDWNNYGNYSISWFNKNKTEFTLSTNRELAGLSYLVANGYSDFKGVTIKLGADIDLGGKYWTPIGTEKNTFYGSFDGQGHTIQGIYIRFIPEQIYYGFFGRMAGRYYKESGTEIKFNSIKNTVFKGVVNVNDVLITNNKMKEFYVGGIAGKDNDTSLENCICDMQICFKIIDSPFTDNLGIDYYVGGLIGWMSGGEVNYCKHEGDIIVEDAYVYSGTPHIGGFVGHSDTNSINYCENISNCIRFYCESGYGMTETKKIIKLTGDSYCRNIVGTIDLGYFAAGNTLKYNYIINGIGGINCYSSISKIIGSSKYNRNSKIILYLNGTASYLNSDIVTEMSNMSFSTSGNASTSYSNETMKSPAFLEELNMYSIINLGEPAWAQDERNLPYIIKMSNSTNIYSLNYTEFNNPSIYNLSGQRLDKPRKGINIIGGKKVMVK